MRKYAWTRNIDDEIWYGGPCASLKECVEEAQAEGYTNSDTFAVGYIEKYNAALNLADEVIERLQQDAYDEVGEVSDGWLDFISLDQKNRLNSKLKDVILNWLKETNDMPTFYKIFPIKEYTLEEALAVHSERMSITAKGGMC